MYPGPPKSATRLPTPDGYVDKEKKTALLIMKKIEELLINPQNYLRLD